MGIRGLSISQLPVTLKDIDEVWDQAGIGEASASGSDASSARGHPQDSGSPSASSLRSSEREGEQISRSERSETLSANSVKREPPAGSVTGSARSEKSASVAMAGSVNSMASRATVAAATILAASPAPTKSAEHSRGSKTGEVEIAAVAAGGAAPISTREDGESSSPVDQRSQGDGESGDDGTRSSGSAGDDIGSQGGQRITSAAAAPPADCADQKHPSAALLSGDDDDWVILSEEGQRNGAVADIDGPSPLQTKPGAEGSGHANLEATRLKREPPPEGCPNGIPATDVGEEHKCQQEEGVKKDETHEVSEREDEGGGNKSTKERTDDQDKRDGHTDSIDGASMAIASTFDNDKGMVLCRKSTERPIGETNNEINHGITREDALEDTMPLVHQDPESPDSVSARLVEEEPPANGGHSPAPGQTPAPSPSFSGRALPHTTLETVASDSNGDSNEDASSPSQQNTGTDGITPALSMATITARQGAEEYSSAKKSAPTTYVSPDDEGIPDLGGELAAHRAAGAGEKGMNDGVGVESPTNSDTPTDMLVEGLAGGNIGGNSSVGRSPPQRGRRPSTKSVGNVGHDRDSQTISPTTQVTQLAAEASEQDSVDIHGIIHDTDVAACSQLPRLDDENICKNQERPEKRPDEHPQVTSLATGQSASNHKLDEVCSKAEKEGDDEEDTIGSASAGRPATPGSHEGGLSKGTPVWAFPPSFEALVTLSTASEAVECIVEGEIMLQEATSTASSRGAVATPSTAGSADGGESIWRALHCVYKIGAKETGSNHIKSPAAHTDLEDDDAQARLEDLLGRAYGLSMEDVLERFSPDTDLGSGDAVVRSFTESICQLRPSLLLRSQDTKDNGEEGGGDGAVYKAVGAALRGDGDGDGSEWLEMQVRVSASRVVEVGITTTSGGIIGREDTTKAAEEELGPQGGGRSRSSNPLYRIASDGVVDCSGVVSPPELRAHLVAGGIPESGVDVLDRAGFFGAWSVLDIAGVLAALAQEAKRNGDVGNRSDAAQPSPMIGKGRGGKGWPGIDPGRQRSRVLRLLPHGRDRSSATTDGCTAVVTGTPEDIKLEISLVAIEDGLAPQAVGAATVRVSCLRPLGTSLLCPESAGATVRETGGRSNTQGIIDGNKVTFDRRKPEGVPHRKVRSNTAGLGVGDRVEARFGGKSEWFPGIVRAIRDVHDEDTPAVGGRGGGRDAMKSKLPTVAVDYDDGDVEERVPRIRVRLPGQKQPRFLKEGDEVDVKRGRRIALARVLVRPSSMPKEGHYDLELFNDGSREGGDLVENCPRSAIMALHGWPPTRE